MTLPQKDERGYLELTDDQGTTLIEGEPRHVAELEALFQQRGIPCKREPDLRGRESLRLSEGADREAAQHILDAYKAAKGS